MGNDFSIHPVAHIRTDFSEKFGIPRQSGLADKLIGKVVLEPEYRCEDAVRELGGFSHIWLIWQFSECVDKGGEFHATVRPPRLGGNKRVGVFASRSPFRPNNLGLSCVKLEKIDLTSPESPTLIVSGVDMLDGTPVFDIKPYIPLTDCRNEALQGYTALTRQHILEVDFDKSLLQTIPPDKQEPLIQILSGDPRPGYADEPEREYGLSFAGFEIGFRVNNNRLTVTRAAEIKQKQ